MTDAKVLQVNTAGPTHLVVRNQAGRKLFDLYISGVSVTVAVALNLEIKIKPNAATEDAPWMTS